ncbi:MAG: hypothetical protein PHX82_17080 [Paracoccaceae bacterium]|nr:hypothetical protein [Paracoccaceae bacterium]
MVIFHQRLRAHRAVPFVGIGVAMIKGLGVVDLHNIAAQTGEGIEKPGDTALCQKAGERHEWVLGAPHRFGQRDQGVIILRGRRGDRETRPVGQGSILRA